MSKAPSKSRLQSAAPPTEPGSALRLEVCTGLTKVAPEEWDSLLELDDAPLLTWGYLQGLEEAGCVGPASGWLPAHLLLRAAHGDESGRLVAAAPAYVKTNSDGEWVYDLDWAEFAQQRRLAYYPKLVLAVPFNPVTGGRLLTHPGLPAEERQALRTALLQAAQAVCKSARLSSAHVLFPRGPGFQHGASAGGAADGPLAAAVPLATAAPATLPPETAAMPAAGFLLRQQEQYHFLNEGYRTFDDFLARLRSHRRSAIRRERRELAAAGITVRTHSGLGRALGFTAAELDQVFDMYVATSQRYTGGPPFLNRSFFRLCAERLGERLELVLARDRHGQVLGGAWNLRGDRRLYGRYWGRRDVGLTPGADLDPSSAADPGPSYDPDNEAGAAPVSFLHFEVCYYHAVERCIQAGLKAFEPGHGGDQKLVRGFTPSYTYSAHYLADPRLRLPIEAFLKYEAPLVEEALQAAARRSNLRAPAPSPSCPATAADSPRVSSRASEPISSVARKTALKDEV